MCADHGNWVSSLPFLADRECDDRGSISCQVVLSARDEGGVPAIALLDLFEACFREAFDGRVDCVVC